MPPAATVVPPSATAVPPHNSSDGPTEPASSMPPAASSMPPAEAKPLLHRGKSGIFKVDETYSGNEMFCEGVENGIAAMDLCAKANAPSIETKAQESKFPLPTVPECVNEAITTARTQCLRVTPEEQWALSKQKRAEMADKGDGKGGKKKENTS